MSRSGLINSTNIVYEFKNKVLCYIKKVSTMWVLFLPEYIWISSFFILIVHSWVIFQLYHVENKLIFNEKMMGSALTERSSFTSSPTPDLISEEEEEEED